MRKIDSRRIKILKDDGEKLIWLMSYVNIKYNCKRIKKIETKNKDINKKNINRLKKNMLIQGVHDVGFEPTKQCARDLKPRPFDRSGNHALFLLPN